MTMCVLKILIPNLCWLLGSCAPLFSDMQSARLVGKRKFEVTPGYSSVGLREEGYKEKVASFIGFQAAYGISENVDLRFRFERVRIRSSNDKDTIRQALEAAGINPDSVIIRTCNSCNAVELWQSANIHTVILVEGIRAGTVSGGSKGC